MEKKLNTNPLVSIITVNYNQCKVTEELLQSLQDINYPNIEIIVVDNASPSCNPDILLKKHPNIKLIKNKVNLGFAGGNNVGIRASKGEYLLFINNDTEVPPNFIEPLVKLLCQNKTIGMVSPKIKFYWDKNIIQYAGYKKMNRFTMRNTTIGMYEKDSDKFNYISETEAGHGAAMMVPTEVVRKVGLMPEIYFLYYEELDWSEMIKRAGYKIYYQPKSVIYHKESISTGKNSPLKTYYSTRSRVLFTRRNLKRFPKTISILFQYLISFPKNSITFLGKGQFQHFKVYVKALLWNITHYKGLHSNKKFCNKE